MTLDIEPGLNWDSFKKVVMAHLNKIDYKGDKKEMCVLGWMSYSDY